MAKKQYKILIPKPCAVDEAGMQVELMKADSIVDGDTAVMESNMQMFVENGWAIEVKMDAPEEVVEVEAEVKRARNDKGQLQGDDPSTPDVNEAWEGGEAPKKATKKKTSKKTTKKTK
jgi:hypothetical protein